MRPSQLLRTVVAHLPTRSAWKIARHLVTRANGERDAQNFAAAAVLYAEALRLVPDAPRFHIQYGHMYKEAGDFAGAERHYLLALAAMPDNADLAMQLGHFYKLSSRLDEAETHYRRATRLRPGWSEAEYELTGVAALETGPARIEPTAIDMTRLAAELLPGPLAVGGGALREGFEVRRLGATRARARGGYRRVLRGVEAIRGFIVADAGLSELVLRLDGAEIRREPLRPFPLAGGQSKYVFNVWHDFSRCAKGPHQIELATIGAPGASRTHRQIIDILPPVDEAEYGSSDCVIGALSEGADAVATVNARPSVVRSANRALLDGPPRSILVQRVDQLGDLVCSVPALRRLRGLYPAARLVGLVTSANVDLARTLGLFDEVIVAPFGSAGASNRRIMSAEAQEALRQQLAPYAFDIAIDLGETSGSRPLLRLSGARFLYGFKDREFPWLSAGFELNTHDPGNHAESAGHGRKLVALVDGMAAILAGDAEPLRRRELDRERLIPLGIGAHERYVVLHTGARLGYSRWPGYGELATLLVARTDLKIVLVSDEPPAASPAGGNRVLALHGRLDFDVFDALLSFAELFIGNDSGPKHLAALRGAPVISIHMARLNWNEWGQTGIGAIISRRVPCAGCGIGTNAEECGQDYACIRQILPTEVLNAALDHLGAAARNFI